MTILTIEAPCTKTLTVAEAKRRVERGESRSAGTRASDHHAERQTAVVVVAARSGRARPSASAISRSSSPTSPLRKSGLKVKRSKEGRERSIFELSPRHNVVSEWVKERPNEGVVRGWPCDEDRIFISVVTLAELRIWDRTHASPATATTSR